MPVGSRSSRPGRKGASTSMATRVSTTAAARRGEINPSISAAATPTRTSTSAPSGRRSQSSWVMAGKPPGGRIRTQKR